MAQGTWRRHINIRDDYVGGNSLLLEPSTWP
jgi:hypothetical protein